MWTHHQLGLQGTEIAQNETWSFGPPKFCSLEAGKESYLAAKVC